jgi:hypothetical protein
VLGEQLKLLVGLWTRPASAMGAILDRGSALVALLAAMGATFAVESGALPGFGLFMPMIVLGVVYVPGVLVLSALLGRLGGVGMVFQRDYSPLFTCIALAWTAACLPVAAAGWLAPPAVAGGIGAAAGLYFLLLVFFAVRTLFGVGVWVAAGVVVLSWIPVAAMAFLWGPLRFLFGWIASPFVLLYAWYFLGGELSNLGSGLRRGQNLRRNLEAAAINPHDADAQYQLGLIHQERRQYTEAIRRFQAAVAIDPEETDAQFQLGRIAREQGRVDDALARFQTVLRQDEKHNLSEIRREMGAAYLAAGRFEEARRELEIYTDRRPYDPEGLCHYGQALEALGDAAGAREMYRRAVEAARTAPRYRRRFTARWSRLAQKQAGKLA